MTVRRRHLTRTQSPQYFAPFNQDDELYTGMVCYIDNVSGRNWLTKVAVVFTGTKWLTSVLGIVRGFGTTLGVGTSDIELTDYTKTDDACSVYIEYLCHGLGGGPNLGRLFQKTATANGQDRCQIAGTAGRFIYVRSTSSGNGVVNGEWARGTDDIAHQLVIVSDGVNTAGTKMSLDGSALSAALGTGSGTTTDASDSTTPFYLGNRGSDSLRNWDGWIGRFIRWNRVLTDAEVRRLYENVNRLIAPRTVRRPASGGTNTYTLSISGGFILSGAVALLRTRLQAITGGVSFSGAVPLLRTRAISPSGGVVFSGGAAQIRTRVQVPSGGVTFGGSAPITFIPAGGSATIPMRTLMGVGA